MKNSRYSLADRAADLYETPPAAVHALLGVERLPRRIWEPACGPGSIVRVLRGAGHDVIATDLIDWNCPDSASGIDFLTVRQAPHGCTCICTNPPFKIAARFVAHTLELVPRVFMLLRLAFLESECRTPILESGRLARVHVFRNRLPRMHTWFCFDRKHGGPTVIDRITARLNDENNEHRLPEIPATAGIAPDDSGI